MDNEYPKDQESSATDLEHPDAAMSRRRFTRAGVTGSVVLGALASKPVLGAAPYQCTVSGQVSGNLSRAGSAAECGLLGDSPSEWVAATSWPSPFDKGTAPTTNCSFTGGGRVKGTEFNGYSGLIAAFYFLSVDPPGSVPRSCTITLAPQMNAAATMLQVLSTTDTNEKFRLGRAVVASLLNASRPGLPGTDYPVTTQTIIAMFNATFNGGTYPVNSTTSWDRALVILYLESLYSS